MVYTRLSLFTDRYGEIIMMYPSDNVRFKIHSGHLWGFTILVVDRDDNVLESYRLDQVFGSVHEDPYCSWQLRHMDGDIYDDPILTGRLVNGRTDSFAPLMKCLKFLEERGE